MKPAIFSLVLLSVLCMKPAMTQGTLHYCGYQNLSILMEQVPTSWWSWPENNNAMWLWNQYVDVYRYTASNGTWGKNGVNEFAGWPSDADLYRIWGFHWGSAIAMCMIRWSCECCRITESDVAFNPGQSWTTDNVYAETNHSVNHYMSVLMHELGHTWGEQNKGKETYDYNVPSVMHRYYSASVHPAAATIHAPDAYLIRRCYANQKAALPRKDMAVHSHYAHLGLSNSYTDTSRYAAGTKLTIRKLTVENTGTTALSNVRVRLYLSTNRTISTSDIQLGEWGWSSFPAEAYGVYDLSGTIPRSTSQGSYYVGAIVTSNGHNSDDLSQNDRTYLYSQVTVGPPVCHDDGFEPNDSFSQAATIQAKSYTGLQICQNNEDWFKIRVPARSGLDVSIQFSHAAGDLDLDLYDASRTRIDYSHTSTDGEAVSLPLATSGAYYYVRVFGYQGAQNGYSLRADLPTHAPHIQTTGSGAIGSTVYWTLTSAADAGLAYQVGTSFGTGPISIDTRRLDLDVDALFFLSVNGFVPAVFRDYRGVLDAGGRAAASLVIPNDPLLKGVKIYTAFLTLKASAPSGVSDISPSVPVAIQ